MTSKTTWKAIWTAWLLAIVISFAALEALSWTTGTTLSRYTWELSVAWPVFPAIYGMVFGGLAVHFWWHWYPEGDKGTG